jgi:DNA-binding NarL/FixJ family response regulator
MILILDDEPVVWAGLRHVLKKASGVQVEGEALDGRKLLGMLAG